MKSCCGSSSTPQPRPPTPSITSLGCSRSSETESSCCASDEAKAHMLRTSPAGLVSHHFQQVLTDPKFDIFRGAPVLIVISAAPGPMGHRRLCSCGRKPDACGARGRARDLLDRICSGMAWNRRRQISPNATRERHPSCSYYRRTFQVCSAEGLQEAGEDRLGFIRKRV
jgi:hypothetical protein